MARRRKPAQTADKQAQTADGFQNFVQRVGLGTGSSISAGTYSPSQLISRNRLLLEWAYRQNWVAGKIVDIPAEDMTRAGIEILSSDEPDQIEEMQAALNRMGFWDQLLDGLKWGRLYGGAIGVFQIEGQDMGTPLRVETVGRGQFTGLTVYDRWQVQPDLSQLVQTGPMMGTPEFYRVVSSYDQMGSIVDFGQPIHYSRVIRFIGTKMPAYQAMTEQWWGTSVLERLYDRLVSFDTATMGAANLLDKAHLRMVGIDGLREILSMGGPAEQALVANFHYIRQMQTNDGITLLDKNDAWQTSAYSFSGLSDMMLQFNQQVTGAADIPLVRFFGQSPAGLSATGESDLRNYYDSINSQQESRLRLGIERALAVLHQSLYGTPMPSDMTFTFCPLWQMSQREKAEVAKITTESVVGAFDAGLIDTATAMKELRQASHTTGIFSNISDEQIEEAESEPELPPVEAAMPEVEVTEEVKPASALDKIKAWIGK